MRPEPIPGPEEVVAFWRAAGPSRWFAGGPSFDALVRRRLGRAHAAAAEGLLDDWADSPTGSLALLILLDQAPRNMFRDSARAFATDPDARAVARAAIARGHDRRAPRALRTFFYLPFEHSEEMSDQELCLSLYRAAGDADGLRWAEIHADVIRRFGRFPHRNPALGRETTAEEQRFLAEGGFSR